MEIANTNNIVLGDRVRQLPNLHKKDRNKVFKSIPGVPKGEPKNTNFNLVLEGEKEKSFPFTLTTRIEIYKSKDFFKKGSLISGYISKLGKDDIELLAYKTEPKEGSVEIIGKRLSIPYDDLVFMVKKPLPGQQKFVYQFVFKDSDSFVSYYNNIKAYL